MAVTKTIQDQVTELYVGFFGRAPDAAGMGYWAERLGSGTATVYTIANEFSKTPEFVSNYGALTPSEQIDKIYVNVLDRKPDADGKAYWLAELTKGTPIGNVVYNIVNAAFQQVGTADGLLVQNKVTVGEYFSLVLASNDTAVAKTAYTGVTSAASSVAAKEVELAQAVAPTYTLTTSIDTFVASKPYATFKGDNSTIQIGDSITGTGAGNKFDAYLGGASGTYGLNSTGVQTFNVQALSAAQTLNMVNTTGVEALWNVQSTSDLTLTNVAAAGTTIGVNNTAVATNVTFKNGVTDVSLALIKAGTVDTDAVILMNGSNGLNRVTTVNINAVSGDSFISLDDGTALNVSPTTVNITGAGFVDIGDAGSELDETTTVNGVTNTGGFAIDLTQNTVAVNVTGGIGDDVVFFGANQFNTSDVVNLGAGVNGLILGDSLDVTSGALVNAIKAAQGISILGTSAAKAQINSSAFSQVLFATTADQNLGSTGATGTPGQTGASGPGNSGGIGGAGSAAISFTLDSGDSLSIGAFGTAGIVGGAGGLGGAGAAGTAATSTGGAGGAGGEGGAGILASARVDTGTTALTIAFDGEAAVTIEGGAGGTGATGGAAGTGAGATGASGGTGLKGVALDATTVENLTISTIDSATDLTFVANGSSYGQSTALKVGANAVITITGAGDVNFSRLDIQSISGANNLTVNGSAATGAITVVTGTGNDTITGGNKADVIAAGIGINTLTGGAGRDQFQFVEGWSQFTTGSTRQTTITDFVAGSSGDRIQIADSASNFTASTPTFQAYELKTLAPSVQSDITAAASLNAAIGIAEAVLSEDQVAGFTYGGTTYVLFDGTSTADTVVKLTGVVVSDLVQANFA